MKKRFFAVVLVFLLVCQAAMASELNLNERFGGPALEYNGNTYYPKNRVSTVLAIGYNPGTDGSVGSPELVLVLIVDDNAKTMLPLQFDPSTIVDWSYETQDGETAEDQTLREVFDGQVDGETSCQRMMDVLNGLLPAKMIESYVAFNLEGLTVLDGVANDETNTVGEALIDRMRVIKAQVEQSGEASDLINQLSDYILSNMKSGALLKVVDKAERFEVQPRTLSPMVEDEETPETIRIDAQAFMDMMVGVYYKEPETAQAE